MGAATLFHMQRWRTSTLLARSSFRRGLRAGVTAPQEFELVDTPEALSRLTSHIEEGAPLAIDTEFSSFPRRLPQLDLVQIATKEVSAIVDPHAFKSLAMLVPLFHAVCDAELVVAHSPHIDFELMHAVSNRLPVRPFCTQVAADMLGIGDCIGLGDLLCRELNIPLDKRWSNSNWATRPLEAALLEYAIGDVAHLLPLQQHLQAQMKASDTPKMEWFEQEMQRRLGPRVLAKPAGDPTLAWTQLPLRVLRKLDATGLYVAKQLATWREKRSVAKNMSHPAVMTDSVIHALANQRPSSWVQLEACGPLKPGLRSRFGSELLACIQVGVASFGAAEEHQLLDAVAKHIKVRQPEFAVVAVLEAGVHALAAEHRVSPGMLVNRDELRAFASGDADVEELGMSSGWRKEMIGDRLQMLMRGEVVVSLNQGKVTLVDV